MDFFVSGGQQSDQKQKDCLLRLKCQVVTAHGTAWIDYCLDSVWGEDAFAYDGILTAIDYYHCDCGSHRD